MFGLEGVFSAGIGFDLIGAYYVARGLLGSPEAVARRIASLWNGNPANDVSEFQGRNWGLIGIGALILGFSLQAAGWILTAGLSDPPRGSAAGVSLSLLIPIGLVYFAERVVRRRWLRTVLREAARYDANEKKKQGRPSAKWLASRGSQAAASSDRQRQGESDEDYVRRAFGVTETRD